MTAAAMGLIFVSTLLHAGWNLLLKRTRVPDQTAFTLLFLWVAALLFSPVAAWAMLAAALGLLLLHEPLTAGVAAGIGLIKAGGPWRRVPGAADGSYHWALFRSGQAGCRQRRTGMVLRVGALCGPRRGDYAGSDAIERVLLDSV